MNWTEIYCSNRTLQLTFNFLWTSNTFKIFSDMLFYFFHTSCVHLSKPGISFTNLNTGSSGNRNPCREAARDGWSTFLSDVYFFTYKQFISLGWKYLYLQNGNIYFQDGNTNFLELRYLFLFDGNTNFFRMEISISLRWKYQFL